MLHRDTHLTNLRGLSLTTPGECDGFCANHQRVALPLLSAGGQIAVLEVPPARRSGQHNTSGCSAGDPLALSRSSPSLAVSLTRPCPPSRTAQQWLTFPGTPLTRSASLLVCVLSPGECAKLGPSTRYTRSPY